jgi:hypothetical protein
MAKFFYWNALFIILNLSCDADSTPTYFGQGYKAGVLKNDHHPHVLHLLEDPTEEDD